MYKQMTTEYFRHFVQAVQQNTFKHQWKWSADNLIDVTDLYLITNKMYVCLFYNINSRQNIQMFLFLGDRTSWHRCLLYFVSTLQWQQPHTKQHNILNFFNMKRWIKMTPYIITHHFYFFIQQENYLREKSQEFILLPQFFLYMFHFNVA